MGFRGVPREEMMDGVRVLRVPSIRARLEVCHTHEMATYVQVAVANFQKRRLRHPQIHEVNKYRRTSETRE